MLRLIPFRVPRMDLWGRNSSRGGVLKGPSHLLQCSPFRRPQGQAAEEPPSPCRPVRTLTASRRGRSRPLGCLPHALRCRRHLWPAAAQASAQELLTRTTPRPPARTTPLQGASLVQQELGQARQSAVLRPNSRPSRNATRDIPPPKRAGNQGWAEVGSRSS